jgi:hypothetical protein
MHCEPVRLQRETINEARNGNKKKEMAKKPFRCGDIKKGLFPPFGGRSLFVFYKFPVVSN